MALISMHNVSWGLGGAPLLDKVNLQIEKGEKICLLGRNGVGKSSLIKILNGDLLPDSGDIGRQQGVTTATLEQEVTLYDQGTLFEVVADGMGEAGRALIKLRRRSSQMPSADTPAHVIESETLQNHPGSADTWTLGPRIEDLLSRAGLDPGLFFTRLSAGMKRRALLCRALVRQPDLLLLDEPTNHMDIETIIWMEEYLDRHVQTLLFVSHDRAFTRRMASRILELDRGGLSSYACDYPTYLKRKEEAKALADSGLKLMCVTPLAGIDGHAGQR